MSDDNFATFSDETFDADVLQRPGLTVVDFWAAWCAPCKQLTKILRQVRPEIPEDVLIGSVDADANPRLLERYAVKSIPTLLFFKDGELIETMTGVDRRQIIKKTIARLN